MTTNFCSNECYCGNILELKHCISRPMKFVEYLEERGISSTYTYEYINLIGAKAQCPVCKRIYFMWICFEQYDNNLNRTVHHSPIPDLSFWHTFNDEPCYDVHCTMCYGDET